jgi:hypothetical protein
LAYEYYPHIALRVTVSRSLAMLIVGHRPGRAEEGNQSAARGL